MRYRVHVSRDFIANGFAVHVMNEDVPAVLTPTSLVFDGDFQPGTETPAALRLPDELARALYDALGAALGGYHPEAKQAAEALTIERRRVDSLMVTVQSVAEASASVVVDRPVPRRPGEGR